MTLSELGALHQAWRELYGPAGSPTGLGISSALRKRRLAVEELSDQATNSIKDKILAVDPSALSPELDPGWGPILRAVHYAIRGAGYRSLIGEEAADALSAAWQRAFGDLA